jgi:hypothetical protein
MSSVRMKLWAATVALGSGCAGNGQGLDQNGQPIGASGSGNEPLTADFASIQDNVLTPICSRCHIGPGAPEGLQLDADHSYQLLVGVPSVEQPDVLRVAPGDPDNSYLVRKIEGESGISGGQMPLGEAPLPQATIAAIRQWITDGAQMSSASVAAVGESQAHRFEVTVTSPADGATLRAPVDHLIVGFSREVDASLVNGKTIVLERLDADGELLSPAGAPLDLEFGLAPGDPATVLIRPRVPLGPGRYRLTVHGTGDGGLAAIDATPMQADDYFVFTVESVR